MGLHIRKKKKRLVVPAPTEEGYRNKNDLSEAERLASKDAAGRFAKGNKYGCKPGCRPVRRPKPMTLSAAFRNKLAEECQYDPARRSWAEVIAQSLCIEAMSGKVAAAKELREATEGTRHTISTDWRKIMADNGQDPEEVLYNLMQHVQGGGLVLPEPEEETEDEE